MADIQVIEDRLRKYYKTRRYKGFRVIRETEYKLGGCHHVTFSDQEKQVFAMGLFIEQALSNAFDRIDEILEASEKYCNDNG